MTRNIITIEAKKCRMITVLGTMDEVDNGLKKRIGFTDDCHSCWVENMQCDTK
jgi:hypothetical protein